MRVGFVVVRGRSMEPTYVDGDRLLVLYGVRPRIGRAHVIRLPDGPDGPRPIAVKRITRAAGDGWWVERDNPAEGVDSWLVGEIPTSDVLGVVLLRMRRARRD
ncbi:MAG TPA: S24 family peptidase [Flexivirga sp.]|uniref:S24 family peptidase n=1 Tax=Flexivirga sp. TaxID=1962927 RepID=UPI002C506D02|nr:S24 family peptidase [Flexivirga sp.]HWC21315.1 S24 family peptidase [Flexivirga sp.]